MGSETKHTPGPWEVLGPFPSIYVGVMVDGGSGGEYPEPPMYEPLCQVHLCPDFETEASDEVKSNAHLIAAAPELLKACEDMFDHLDGCSHGYTDRLWQQAEAAIKKARNQL